MTKFTPLTAEDKTSQNQAQPTLLKNNKFFSLKWSVLILLSLIFVSINTFFYQHNRNNLLNDFESSRELTFAQNKAQLKSLLKQSTHHLLEFAELIPLLHNVNNALKNNNTQQLIKNFDTVWPKLEFQSQIDSIGFIDKNQHVIQSWGSHSFSDTLNIPEFQQKLTQSQELEKPIFQIYCFITCNHYGFIPIAVKGDAWGSLVIVSALSETIMNFSKTSNIDIAMLYSPSDVSKASHGSEFHLKRWNKEIMLLSNFQKLRPIFSVIDKDVSFESTFRNLSLVKFEQNTYEIKSYKLPDSKDLFITYVEDVSDAIDNINIVTKELFLTGILSLLFSELALLAILWSPLSRLKNASDIIPLLANNAFSTARKAIGKQKPGRYLKNEIDILDENIIEVSHRLEELQDNVNQRTLSLAEKMNELTRERDFIRNLLNTAQVIIIVQNVNGVIKQTNKYIVELSNYDEEELKNINFFKLTTNESSDNLVKFGLRKIITGDIDHYKNESKLVCKSGAQRTIEWLHSKIESSNSDQYDILSVGLDLTDRKIYEEEISWLADHDSLTGLLNRRRFQSLLRSSINSAKRYSHTVALLFLDLDNFKHINDTMGHQTGDFLIQSAAANLKLVLRESDYIARFGGDEFAIILPQIDTQGAIDVADKINKCLASMRTPTIDKSHRTTSSIGIAIYPEHGQDDKELLSNADLAMYQAKARGRGCWHLFSKSDDTRKRFENLIYWRNKINDALSHDKFELYYQPIVSLRDNSTSHYEVLIRMRDDDNGGEIILPAPFINVAEKTGLIHSIDHFVVKKAIEEIDKRNHLGQRLKLAINLSAHAFGDDKLLELLQSILSTSTIDPGQLIFEITETAALSDLSGAAELIQKIRSLGCLFALDDFGVGFSTFYYLKELPVDYVKIDGSFIQKLPNNRNDQILVKAITEIAKELNKKVIAEFVEDNETMALLKKFDVDYAQGFHIGIPAKTIENI